LFLFASILFILALLAIFISLHDSLNDAGDSIPEILDSIGENNRAPRVIRIGEPRYNGRRQSTRQLADIVQLPLRLEMPQPNMASCLEMQQAA
jgi:hypothetical protein